ncbi:MAG: VanZ family protein [Acidobacteria bacterium]|nr:VanZ family protein [Acidobacteriota bacterium]
MASIYFFSTDNFSGENTGSLFWSIFHAIFPDLTEEQFQPIHYLIRKAAHFTEYGILALLLFRAFRSGGMTLWRRSWTIYSFLIVVVYALLDEYHQTHTRSRTGSIHDSLTDIAGGFTALFLLWLVRRRQGS